MIFLAIKTDNESPRLILVEGNMVLDEHIWLAEKALAKQLPSEIERFLKKNNVKVVDGYVGYLGPGSFTGLRIGISAINALAYVYNRPIVGVDGDDWVMVGTRKLLQGQNDNVLMPQYGSDARITAPKK